jgi:protein-S-isoprenylcysteine O-methyltransferase Ste14
MSLQKIYIYISVIWLLSEIILAVVKRDKSAKSSGLDKLSLPFLWLIICSSIIPGIYFGIKGIGRVNINGYWITIISISLIIIGLVIRWVAILSLRHYFTVNISIQENHRIIDTGIYKYIRHPAYTGSLISFLGLGLSFSSWLSMLIVFIPVTFAFIYRIHYEEKALTQAFGAKYLEYSIRTWRLVPGIY